VTAIAAGDRLPTHNQADDHKVRWISVSPAQAHAHLLSAIGIALRKGAIAGSGRRRLAEHRRRDSRPRDRRRRSTQGGTPKKRGDKEAGQWGEEEEEEEEEAAWRGQDNEEEEEEDPGARTTPSVVGALAGTLTRILSSGGAKAPVQRSCLFPQACAVAKDIVDLFCIMPPKRDPGFAQPPKRVGGNPPPRAGLAVPPSSTPLEDEMTAVRGRDNDEPPPPPPPPPPPTSKSTDQREEQVAVLLRSVAETLVRLYPDDSDAAVVKEPNLQRKYQDGNTGACGASRVDECRGSASVEGGGGNDWDDWDDDDDDDGDTTSEETVTNVRATSSTGKLKSDTVGLRAALQGTAALMRSAAAFFASSPTNEPMDPNTTSSSPLAASSCPFGASTESVTSTLAEAGLGESVVCLACDLRRLCKAGQSLSLERMK